MLEEGQQFVMRPIPCRFDAQRLSARERFLLQPHVRMEVHLRRLGGLVPEPERDHGAIHTVVQKVHRYGMSAHMRRDLFPFERRAIRGSQMAVFREATLDRIATESAATDAGKSGSSG